jgi:dihydroorotate dehydrogenase electron transfer subunit
VRLLIGSDFEQTAVIRAANELHASDQHTPLLVLLGAAESFAFRPRPSTILVPGMPAGVIAAVPSLEEFGIASRLASEAGLPGCYDGPVTELAELWLKSLQPVELAEIEILFGTSEETARVIEELGREMNVPAGTIKTAT